MGESLQCCPTAGQEQVSSLKSCLASDPEPDRLVTHEVLDGKWGTCFVLEKALGPAECLNLIEAARTRGFGKAVPAYPLSYRNNSRLVVDDAELAEALFYRIRRQLPDPIVDEDGAGWRLVGLNKRFRFCRYGPGEFFTIHRDGVFHSSAKQCSRLTFMIYLNSSCDFEGGSTRFFPSSDPAGAPLASVAPQNGTLIVFDHRLWHDGALVTGGIKYIMRSDILYEAAIPEVNTQTESLDAHSGYIWSVVDLADGQIASGGRDKTIRIWRRNGDSLTCQEILEGHANSITALSPAGRDELWSGSRDRTIRIWRRGESAFSCAGNIDAHEGTVLCLTKLKDGRMASGGADGIIRLWNRNGECSGRLAAEVTWVWDIKALEQDTIVSASEDGKLRWWGLRDGKCLATITTDGGPIRSLALLRNAELMATGSADGGVRIWRVPRTTDNFVPQLVQRLSGHRGIVRALVELPNGWLATGAEDDRIVVWDLAGGTIQTTLHHNDFVTSLAVLSEGILISGSYDGKIGIWPQVLRANV